MNIRLTVFAIFFGLALHTGLVEASVSRCEGLFVEATSSSKNSGGSSYNEVLAAMERAPYDRNDLPLIPIRLWRFFEKGVSKGISFFVGRRSAEILNETEDFRSIGVDKPIHPMGIGFEGRLEMRPTRWSGAFRGGVFPVLARASISQGNPMKQSNSGEGLPRSTALALKVFGTGDPHGKTQTANVVFQNDLNGSTVTNGLGLNWLDAIQTNQPALNILKIRKSYEVMTLIGIALASLRTPADRTAKFPYINPQIRPLHPLSEIGVDRAEDIHTPTWMMVQPRVRRGAEDRQDFRDELIDTIERDGALVFSLYASDRLDLRGQIVWEPVGQLIFTRGILSAGVDQNLKFPHTPLNSARSGIPFSMPRPSSSNNLVPDDIQ